MTQEDFEVPLDQHGDGMYARGTPRPDTSLGELFKRLTSDTGELIRQEANLAKAELTETGSRLAGDARGIGIALGLALAGAMALVAFLIIGLGNVLGDRYWLSSLIVGGAALLVGMTMAKSAVNDIKSRSIKPQQTIDTLREDKAWASQQARELSHDLTTDPTKPSVRR
ncbi:MAG TPA: phage holin family protein [Gemmatimonas sp.]|nr:phage holin family protein [Gemmatimonas sp.]